MIAFTASYYGISPLVVDQWKTKDVHEWHDEAVKIETAKAKALKKGMENGQKS